AHAVDAGPHALARFVSPERSLRSGSCEARRTGAGSGGVAARARTQPTGFFHWRVALRHYAKAGRKESDGAATLRCVALLRGSSETPAGYSRAPSRYG